MQKAFYKLLKLQTNFKLALENKICCNTMEMSFKPMEVFKKIQKIIQGLFEGKICSNLSWQGFFLLQANYYPNYELIDKNSKLDY